MNKITLLTITHLLCTCIGIASGFCLMVLITVKTQPDMPEEMEAVSVDYDHPDTLTAYRGADSIIHFEYLNEQKNK